MASEATDTFVVIIAAAAIRAVVVVVLSVAEGPPHVSTSLTGLRLTLPVIALKPGQTLGPGQPHSKDLVGEPAVVTTGGGLPVVLDQSRAHASVRAGSAAPRPAVHHL